MRRVPFWFSKDDSFGSMMLKMFFFWNPLLCLVVSLLFGTQDLGMRWMLSYVISGITGTLCTGGIHLFVHAEKVWAERQGVARPGYKQGRYMVLGALLMTVGVYVAFEAVRFMPLSWGFPALLPPRLDFGWMGPGLLIGVFFMLFFFLQISHADLKDAAREQRMRIQELEKESLKARLAGLTAQLNPHFLFNAFNTVAALIPVEPVKAEKTVLRLAALFQGVLEASRQEMQPLEKELDLCRDYLEIESVRFGERLHYVFDLPSGLEVVRLQVPVMLLQPLVENAVRHGLSPKADGGTVKIQAKMVSGSLELAVEDDGVGLGNSPVKGAGTTLDNCRKRLDLAYGKKGYLVLHHLLGGGTRVSLSIPTDGAEEVVEAV